jgi:protoporphyrinogen oxidase
LVADLNNVWIGLEYFCNKSDELWSKPDDEFIRFAIEELVHIDIIDKKDVLDGTIIRMEKTYPAYFGSYNQFHLVQTFTDQIENLYLIGRNGTYRYNNHDHSMLIAIAVKT